MLLSLECSLVVLEIADYSLKAAGKEGSLENQTWGRWACSGETLAKRKVGKLERMVGLPSRCWNLLEPFWAKCCYSCTGKLVEENKGRG